MSGEGIHGDQVRSDARGGKAGDRTAHLGVFLLGTGQAVLRSSTSPSQPRAWASMRVAEVTDDRHHRDGLFVGLFGVPTTRSWILAPDSARGREPLRCSGGCRATSIVRRTAQPRPNLRQC